MSVLVTAEREERGREEANATCAEDEDINWDDAAEGIGEGIEGPEGFRDSDDDDEERGGDGGATRRRSEIANGPSREGDGGARGNNGDATDDANRGTDAGGDGEGDSDVEVDATVSRAPPKKGRTAMEVTEWRANGTMRKGRARRMEKETASRQRLLAISRHSPRTLATWEGFVKDGLKNIRTKKRRREEPAEDAYMGHDVSNMRGFDSYRLLTLFLAALMARAVLWDGWDVQTPPSWLLRPQTRKLYGWS
ncbi:hypothetical protein EMIHUDRAFT_236195 [Emiliania huxleyi CCMP1516]|uniref:PiggyBac transposable element-derived protein domain-containing protein n=2 Tax=Emiliania huxleyi TaxID=2903 RepID=A0A0D3JU11_EMIH1|nr:hypothetical protein EMIHUDRAFT_236195 [Emiliania huxleyi CCMP1516]EOD26996.1 hypothetical protein EMIHUDRAFT_236195 [Emiliania huxleyi CCMP1516]|eukprot:XP_005779425.1 hypothetical protein EMIHUDRAFT_236195 [Emiliania huxleyi CCMP1516]